MTLDGGTLKQGDTDYITVTFANRADLSDSHPLKALGLQTPGYSIRLMAKGDKTDADAVAEIDLSPTATGPDIASVEVAPSDTKDLDVGVRGLKLFYEVQISNGNKVFTTEEGQFTVAKELILGV